MSSISTRIQIGMPAAPPLPSLRLRLEIAAKEAASNSAHNATQQIAYRVFTVQIIFSLL
jgi:hypothetical protein